MLEVLLYTEFMKVIKCITEVGMVGYGNQIRWWAKFVSFIVKFSILEISLNHKASILPTYIKLPKV
jgi:hypothetical protein